MYFFWGYVWPQGPKRSWAGYFFDADYNPIFFYPNRARGTFDHLIRLGPFWMITPIFHEGFKKGEIYCNRHLEFQVQSSPIG